MKHWLLLLFSIALIEATYCQSFKYRKYHFEWPAEKPPPIPVDTQFKNQDAVILEERLLFDAGGYQLPPYYYLVRRANYFYVDESSQGLAPIIEKHIRIKFLTQNGIKKYSKVVLPESLDPSDYYTVRPEIRDSIYRPKGEFECIKYFAARVIKPDGKISDAVVDESIQTEMKRVNHIDEKLYNWSFRILNIEPGDELEIYYSYEGVFNIDPSSRIFFNGDLPKQNYSFTFRYPADLLYILTYNNGAEPNDSVMVTKTKPHYTEYYFKRKNLKGGIRECRSRPYKQLPYISYYLHKRDFGAMDQTTQSIAKPLPYPWSYVMMPFVGYQYENLNLRLSRMDKTTSVLNDFVARERQKTKDTSVAGIMSSIQHTLSEDFDYKDDLNAYSAGDAELEHLGKYVSERTLRQISRGRLYEEILNRFDCDYYQGVLIDKRVGGINMDKYEYQNATRISFVVPYNNSFLYFYPKSYRYGYEANELPFYYEDTRTILIPQHEASEKKYELVPSVRFSFLKTPFSSINDNFRSTNGMAAIFLDSMKINFNVRLELTGQFSTLTRGYYLYGDRDTTISGGYYKSIANLLDRGKAEIKLSKFNSHFPFDAIFNIKFSNHLEMSGSSDSIYSFDISEWFSTIMDEDFNASNRQLDYYPDFCFQDTHKFMVKFDRKVQLQNADILKVNVDNKFAQYSFTSKQIDDENILLETNYILKAEMVPAAYAKDVEEVFSAIKKANASMLKIKLK